MVTKIIKRAILDVDYVLETSKYEQKSKAEKYHLFLFAFQTKQFELPRVMTIESTKKTARTNRNKTSLLVISRCEPML